MALCFAVAFHVRLYMQVTWYFENRISPNLHVSQAAGNTNAVHCSFSKPSLSTNRRLIQEDQLPLSSIFLCCNVEEVLLMNCPMYTIGQYKFRAHGVTEKH